MSFTEKIIEGKIFHQDHASYLLNETPLLHSRKIVQILKNFCKTRDIIETTQFSSNSTII